MHSLIERYLWLDVSAWPLMMSGVRASSIRDRIDLVDDRVVELALLPLERAEAHVVAQVIEAELVVLAVGDVGLVRVAFLAIALRVNDDARLQSEKSVETPHPLRVAAREVVVHRDDVDAFAFERVQVRGERRDERLAFARFHLGDATLVEHHPADELHVVVTHLEDAAPRFTTRGERVDEDVVDLRAVVDLLFELDRPSFELLVRELLHLGLEVVDGGDLRQDALHLALVARAENFLECPSDHGAGSDDLIPPRLFRHWGCGLTS